MVRDFKAEQAAFFEDRETVRGVLFRATDPRFHRIFPPDARATVAASGFANTEGPVWTRNRLLFVDPARNRIVSYRPLAEGPEVTTFRYPSGQPLDEVPTVVQNGAMGLTLDNEARLLSCETGSRRVTRTEHDGRITVIADRYEGRRLNRPNDVVVGRDGTIYFTDPAYMLPTPSEPLEQPPAVYRLSPDGELERISDEIGFPNGLALSLDEQLLYVADSDAHEIRALELRGDGTRAVNHLFASTRSQSPGVPDGIKIDVEGNVYCGGGGGLWVFDATGATLGIVVFPDWPRNLAWGDDDWQTLYVTAGTTLYRVRTQTAGVPVGGVHRNL
ncbi:MAG: gluconolactonase [Microvirga sp.]|jgi:gluconolactonase|nr:gluconolactonase [Microvirga sp.]